MWYEMIAYLLGNQQKQYLLWFIRQSGRSSRERQRCSQRPTQLSSTQLAVALSRDSRVEKTLARQCFSQHIPWTRAVFKRLSTLPVFTGREHGCLKWQPCSRRIFTIDVFDKRDLQSVWRYEHSF